jgi:hypothetical protein
MSFLPGVLVIVLFVVLLLADLGRGKLLVDIGVYARLRVFCREPSYPRRGGEALMRKLYPPQAEASMTNKTLRHSQQSIKEPIGWCFNRT